MRVGLCIFPDKLLKVDREMVDYVEFPLSVITALDESEYQILKKLVHEHGIPLEVFNSFVPAEIQLVGRDVNSEIIENYIKLSLNRAADLGADTVIFGSGKARQVYSQQDKMQLVEVAKMMSQEAAKHNITIVVEPLNSNETNFITMVREGFDFANLVDCPNFKTMVDFYHFSKMNENLDDLIFAKDKIAYIHIANYERHVPELSEKPILEQWLKMINEINYDGRVSIEAKFQDFDLEILRVKEILDIFKQ